MATAWQIGDLIQNRWEVHRILRGGMGIVYVVYDHEHNNVYAAKTFQDEIFALSPDIADRFTHEVLTWINLDAHQNVTEARFVQNIAGKPYLFLEYVSGGDLSGWIGTLRLTEDPPQVLRFAIHFCDGMTHARSKGIKAHRDIKPQNCLITQDGALKVTDFGLVRVFDDTSRPDTETLDPESLSLGLTHTGMAAGTPTHMAPEQFDDAKRVDVRADIYSFGVMLYQMVTGRLPFAGRTWQELEGLHKAQQPPALSIQHSTFQTVIETCLAKDPAHRFADFGEVREELAELYKEMTGEIALEPVMGAELSAMQCSNKGASLNILGRPEESLACFDQALEINPSLAGVWNNKGVSLHGMGRSEEAIECHNRALEIDPSYAVARYNKGVSLHGTGRLSDAIECYDRALEINPHLAEAWNNKGLSLHGMGRLSDAIECYDRALEINPRMAEASYNKGSLVGKLGRSEEAIECYDRALEIDPRHAGAWTNKGGALSNLGRSEDAIECHNRALEINPSLAEAWYSKGVALDGLGRSKEEIECYDRALEINPRFAQAWHNKGVELGRLSRLDEAIECHNHALEINPGFAEAWYNKGTALGNSGRIREALGCFEEAHRLGLTQAGTVIAQLRRLLQA
ncbi:MAG TPA: serine/threonine-protein kinase [Pyrinomonadaceae bacterium]|nr:serine/threonine-protein kinase [Pyrinomonadaceae bacterium]